MKGLTRPAIQHQNIRSCFAQVKEYHADNLAHFVLDAKTLLRCNTLDLTEHFALKHEAH